MPKRKRGSELTLPDKLEKHEQDIARALKTAKGFERQRLSKRSHDDGVTVDKQQRLEREIAVLKVCKRGYSLGGYLDIGSVPNILRSTIQSLDLHQTARAHLSSSLLKVKSIAASTDLPEEIRVGVPKPELAEDEKAALHNVTSALFNRKQVKEAVDRAIETVCQALNLPPPGKSKPKKSSTSSQEEQPADRIAQAPKSEGAQQGAVEYEDVTDFEGFQSDVDEPGPVVGELAEQESSSEHDGDSDGEEDESDEEQQLSQYDHLLGSSSDDEDDFDDKKYDQFRGKETVNLDDISVSGSGSESDDEQSSPKPSPSQSPSPPPAAPPKTKRQKKESRPGEVYALPSLMGGYVSGSESASDVDVAAPKKRRGQRARQAIWEKKYGSQAKHVQQSKRQQGGRDSGWDMKRGAVDGDGPPKRTPWKKGVANPFLQRSQSSQRDGGTQPNFESRPPKPAKRDDEGVLHPSWEARKKAKDSQKEAAFSGQKIVFD